MNVLRPIDPCVGYCVRDRTCGLVDLYERAEFLRPEVPRERHTDREPVAGTAFVIRPGIGLRAKGSGILLNLDFDYEAKKYFQPEVTNLDRFNTIGLKGGFQYLPDGAKVGFRIGDTFSISGYEAEDEDKRSSSQ